MKYIERAYPWIVLAPAILPVCVWGGVMYPYLVPKTLLFYAVSLLALGSFVLLAAHGRAFFWARLTRWETWIPGALLVLAYGTSALGVDFYKSFWSLLVRGDGLLMLSCAVVSFYLILLYTDQAFFGYLLRAGAFVGTFVALYGVGEWVLDGGRIGSLLGNAAFFAGYLGITFFATLLLAQTLQKHWRRAAVGGAVIQLIAIILTATRGTILALTVAGVVALVYFSFRRREPARLALFALVIIGGVFFTFRSQLATVPFEPVARIASISFAEGDIASRLFIWKNMMTEIGKSPWLGVGAEHVDGLFNTFYDPTQIAEQWFDRSHNAFLDYMAQYGIGGLLLYLALIASFFTAAARAASRGKNEYAVLIALLAVTYAVQNFFVFDTISSFWLFLALLATVTALSSDDSPKRALSLPAWIRPASWAGAIVLVALIFPVSVQPARAAYELREAYKYQLIDVPQEVEHLSRGVALGTYADLEYGYEVYDMYANNQVAVLKDPARTDAYQITRSVLTTSFNRYPYDARTALYLAHILSLAPLGISVDQNLLSSALERAIRLSPKRSQPWFILTNLSISEANTHPASSQERIAGYTAARDLLARYIDLVPRLSSSHYVLAQLLYASGNTKDADKEAAQGKGYYTSDLETARRAVSYYENELNLTNAAFFLGEVLRLDPTDVGAKSDLQKIQDYEQSKK